MPAQQRTPWPIRGLRCLRLAGHFIWIGLGAALIYPRVDEEQRARLKQRWSHRILTLLAVEVDASPVEAPSGCLIVANHISWMDIFAINAVRPASFISKSEVRQWPFIGWLSARNGTIFLRRGSRGHAREINGEIDALLGSNKDVAVFPEGMTSDGTHLRSFHAALLQPAVETGRPILPLALSYYDASGNRSLAPSYAGETTLMQCFSAILSCRNLKARVVAAPVIESAGKTRRELAELAHQAIDKLLFPVPAQSLSAASDYQARTSSGKQGS